jgi:hypothetical protein
MSKSYNSREQALAYLKDEGFKWNPDTQRHERGEMYISLARAYVGQCINGQWIITRA